MAGVKEAVELLLQIVCAASGIPATRLLGMAPGGLSATGDADERVYFDRVQLIQEIRLTPAMYNLDEMVIRTALNDRPEEVHYNWRPLRQLSENERADIAVKITSAGESLSRIGIHTSEELRTAISNALIEGGAFPGLESAMLETGEGFDLGGNEV